MPRISGNRAGYSVVEMRLSKKKIEALKKSLQQWEHKKDMHKEGPAVTHWKAETCMQDRQTRKSVLAEKALRPEHWVRLSEEFRSDLA